MASTRRRSKRGPARNGRGDSRIATYSFREKCNAALGSCGCHSRAPCPVAPQGTWSRYFIGKYRLTCRLSSLGRYELALDPFRTAGNRSGRGIPEVPDGDSPPIQRRPGQGRPQVARRGSLEGTGQPCTHNGPQRPGTGLLHETNSLPRTPSSDSGAIEPTPEAYGRGVTTPRHEQMQERYK